VPINQGDADVGTAQRARGVKAAEAAAEDDNVRHES
jgi:hypothetical protein